MFWFLLVVGIGVFVTLVLWVYACLTAKKNFYRWARNGLPHWPTYEIYRARYQFGPPYDWDPDCRIKAESASAAVERYLNWYHRTHHKKHELEHAGYYRSTTYQWGKVEVVNLRTKWRSYFR